MRIILSILIIALTTSLTFAVEQKDIQTFHNALFDSLLPETEANKHFHKDWKNQSFGIISTNKQLSELLNQYVGIITQQELLSNEPLEVLYSLQASENNDIAKLAAFVRRTYGYLIYNHPEIQRLAGMASKTKVFDKNCSHNLPKSLLKLDSNYIKHKLRDIDYVIIGTGPAASVIANQLVTRGNFNVVMIEKGPFVVPAKVDTEWESRLMESSNMRMTDDGGIALRNGETVGGGSTVNVDLAFSPLLPSIQKKISKWIEAGIFPRHFVHFQGNDFGKIQEDYQWVAQHIGTRCVQTYEVNRNNLLLLTGANTARPYELNTKLKKDSNKRPPKISALEAFVWPVMNNPKYKGKLHIISDAKAINLINDGKNVSELEILMTSPRDFPCALKDFNHLNTKPGTTVKIKAKNFILSGGSLGNSELLINSKIPNDNIGTGLVMHPSIGLGGIFSEDIKVSEGLSASIYASAENTQDEYFYEAMSADPAFISSIYPGRGSDLWEMTQNFNRIGGFGVMLVDSVSKDNKVYVDDATKTVQVHYNLSEPDKERFRTGITEASRILFEQGAKEIFISSLEPIYNDMERKTFKNFEEAKNGITKLQFLPNQTLLSSAHMQAANKLGTSPENSVISNGFTVWNQQTGEKYKNLFVVDSSSFPTSVGANPMQAIYTLAKMFSDHYFEFLVRTKILPEQVLTKKN